MISVSPVPPEGREKALSLLLSRRPEEEQSSQAVDLLQSSQKDDLFLDGLLVADVDGESVGAVLYVLQPDGTAFVWPPGVPTSLERSSQAVSIADALLDEVCRRLDAADTWLGQAILEPNDVEARRNLERAGFAHLADLKFLQRPLDDPWPSRPAVPLEAVSFDPQTHTEHFARVLERTYAGTRDCPDLNGLRTGEEALEGHRTAGVFDPRLWTLYRVDGADVGLLLLTDHPEQDAWEVVYMGVVPEARGQGYGRAMLLDGLAMARAAGRGAVLLAVDSRNDYAIRVYKQLGFLEACTRSVHGRVHPDRRGRNSTVCEHGA